MGGEGKYTVKAASKLTGITPETLRAWERRYGAVVPGREGKGRRAYSDQDIVRLTLLKQATDQGHAIRIVANQTQSQLESLVEKARPAEDAILDAGQMVSRMLRRIEEYDTTGFEREMSSAAAILPPRRLIIEIIFPLLKEVGERWYRGDLKVAQEHMVSAALRNLIGSLLRIFPAGESGPRMVFATLSGERHEFGALLTCLLAASLGSRCYYLGPDTPAEEVEAIVMAKRCNIVALSLVHRPNTENAERQINRLRETLPAETEIWVGGAASDELRNSFAGKNIQFIADIADFERTLHRARLNPQGAN